VKALYKLQIIRAHLQSDELYLQLYWNASVGYSCVHYQVNRGWCN